MFAIINKKYSIPPKVDGVLTKDEALKWCQEEAAERHWGSGSLQINVRSTLTDTEIICIESLDEANQVLWKEEYYICPLKIWGKASFIEKMD